MEIKCFECLTSDDEISGSGDAVTMLSGTALCAEHAKGPVFSPHGDYLPIKMRIYV